METEAPKLFDGGETETEDARWRGPADTGLTFHAIYRAE